MGSNTNLKTNKTLFIPCDCKSEILVIEYDHEWQMADCAIYESLSSYKNKMSFWHKLRYCYQVLIHNKPYADQMMLNNAQLKDLGEFLKSLDLE